MTGPSVDAHEPLVSIGLPTYRRPAYLREALASVLEQSYRNLQVIVSDNASGDETEAVVRSFGDARVVYMRSESTSSGIENINRCIARAEGKYLMVVCDDDRISPTYVETMVELMETQPIAMAFGARQDLDEEGALHGRMEPAGTEVMRGPEFLRRWCTEGVPVGTPLCLFARTADVQEIGGLPGFPSGDNVDNALMVALALRGGVALSDRCHYCYRLHPSNDWRNISWRDRAGSIRAFVEYLDAEPLQPWWEALPKVERRDLRALLRSLLFHQYLHRFFTMHVRHTARKQLLQATVLFPTDRQYLRLLLTYLAREARSLVRRRLAPVGL